jgi:hypothetical protein
MPTTLMLALAVALAAAPPAGSLTVTHRHLVPVCRDGLPVAAGTRSWPTAEAPITLTFTMRNQPRPGIANASPGHATVTFTPEPGHRYEVEVRSATQAFSTRVWPEGQWAPVVRDRTTDRVVSGEPSWGAPPCPAASGQR